MSEAVLRQLRTHCNSVKGLYTVIWLIFSVTQLQLRVAITDQVRVSAVSGVLKGYDQLLNLVLDEAVEYLRGETHQAAYLVLSFY